MAEATSDEGNVDFWVELRQAEKTGWDHLWKRAFHKVRSFPKNSVAPDKNLSFSCVRANTTVSKANQGQATLTGNSDHTTKIHYIHVDGLLWVFAPPCLTRTHGRRSETVFLLSSFRFLFVGVCGQLPHLRTQTPTSGAYPGRAWVISHPEAW